MWLGRSWAIVFLLLIGASGAESDGVSGPADNGNSNVGCIGGKPPQAWHCPSGADHDGPGTIVSIPSEAYQAASEDRCTYFKDVGLFACGDSGGQAWISNTTLIAIQDGVCVERCWYLSGLYSPHGLCPVGKKPEYDCAGQNVDLHSMVEIATASSAGECVDLVSVFGVYSCGRALVDPEVLDAIREDACTLSCNADKGSDCESGSDESESEENGTCGLFEYACASSASEGVYRVPPALFWQLKGVTDCMDLGTPGWCWVGHTALEPGLLEAVQNGHCTTECIMSGFAQVHHGLGISEPIKPVMRTFHPPAQLPNEQPGVASESYVDRQRQELFNRFGDGDVITLDGTNGDWVSPSPPPLPVAGSTQAEFVAAIPFTEQATRALLQAYSGGRSAGQGLTTETVHSYRQAVASAFETDIEQVWVTSAHLQDGMVQLGTIVQVPSCPEGRVEAIILRLQNEPWLLGEALILVSDFNIRLSEAGSDCGETQGAEVNNGVLGSSAGSLKEKYREFPFPRIPAPDRSASPSATTLGSRGSDRINSRPTDDLDQSSILPSASTLASAKHPAVDNADLASPVARPAIVIGDPHTSPPAALAISPSGDPALKDVSMPDLTIMAGNINPLSVRKTGNKTGGLSNSSATLTSPTNFSLLSKGFGEPLTGGGLTGRSLEARPLSFSSRKVALLGKSGGVSVVGLAIAATLVFLLGLLIMAAIFVYKRNGNVAPGEDTAKEMTSPFLHIEDTVIETGKLNSKYAIAGSRPAEGRGTAALNRGRSMIGALTSSQVMPAPSPPDIPAPSSPEATPYPASPSQLQSDHVRGGADLAPPLSLQNNPQSPAMRSSCFWWHFEA